MGSFFFQRKLVGTPPIEEKEVSHTETSEKKKKRKKRKTGDEEDLEVTIKEEPVDPDEAVATEAVEEVRFSTLLNFN